MSEPSYGELCALNRELQDENGHLRRQIEEMSLHEMDLRCSLETTQFLLKAEAGAHRGTSRIYTGARGWAKAWRAIATRSRWYIKDLRAENQEFADRTEDLYARMVAKSDHINQLRTGLWAVLHELEVSKYGKPIDAAVLHKAATEALDYKP